MIYMVALHVISKGMRILHNLEAEQGLHYLLLVAKESEHSLTRAALTGSPLQPTSERNSTWHILPSLFKAG